jgi:CDP-4-dehydro-6-deoxyglucose reductase, E1
VIERMPTSCKQRWVGVGDMKIGPAEREAINSVLDSGKISEGPRTRDFERAWAEYVGTKCSVAVNSGTSALIAGLTALQAMGSKKGAKVLTTPLTYIATANAVVLTGMQPVFVDVDPVHFCITPDNIAAKLEEADDPSEFAIILPVHLMGYPADMDPINRLAKKYGLITMEDSSQAHGSMYKGKRTGSLSRLSTFSFYIAHNIQAGELGAVATDDHDLARLVRRIKANGRICDCSICTRKTGGCPRSKDDPDRDPRFTHDLIGYNFKTMEFQTALALVQLARAEEIMSARQRNFKYLNQGLESLSGLIELPEFDENVSYLAYPLVLRDSRKIRRQRLIAELERHGVEARPLFGCIPTQQPAYSQYAKEYEGELPVAERLGSLGFYVGCHQYLERSDLDHIIRTLGDALR